MKTFLKKNIAFLLVTAIFVMLLFQLPVSANDSTDTVIDALEYSYVYNNETNAWVESGGSFDFQWQYYNCYAYAIDKTESYNPGDFEFRYFVREDGEEKQTCSMQDYETFEDLVNFVVNDLEVMGYCNVQSMRFEDVVLSDLIASLTPYDNLICVRTNDWDSETRDYHFMKYDRDTNAWYHKLGNTAILKYKGVPTNGTPWYPEYSFWGVEYIADDTYIYDSDIYFVKYSENVYKPSISGTVSKGMYYNLAVTFELDIKTTGTYDYTIRIESSDSFYDFWLNYDIVSGDNSIFYFDGEMDLSTSSSGSFTVNSNYNSNKYRFIIWVNCLDAVDSINNVSISIEHRHNYSSYEYVNGNKHKGICQCGITRTSSHYVSRDEIVNSRYARCLGCGILLDLTKNSVVIQTNPITMISSNGSYILSNGIVVLVDADIEGYLNGTLKFYDANINSEIA